MQTSLARYLAVVVLMLPACLGLSLAQESLLKSVIPQFNWFEDAPTYQLFVNQELETAVADNEVSPRGTNAAGGMTIRHAQESPPSAACETSLDYGQMARQTLAGRVRVPVEQIRVVGVTRMESDHRQRHRRPGHLPDSTLEPVLGDSAVALVSLDAGFGNRACGLFHVLYRAGNEVECVGDAAVIDAESQSMIENECQSVASELERFSSVAVDFRRGPERFLPFLSEKLTTNLDHTSEEAALSAQERRLFATQYLDFLLLGKLAALETTESSLSEFMEQLDRDSTIRQNAGRLRKNLSDLGLLGSQHLKAVRPFLQKAIGFSLFDKHVADGSFEEIPRGTVFYDVTEGPINFLFIWEGARLRLVRISCSA